MAAVRKSPISSRLTMTDNDRKALESHLKGIVNNLPELPGSYQYYDETGSIIYVGKAKNLKRRVASYFNKDRQSGKTRVLVSKIRNITYTVVNSEEDALLLENSLIKQYKPRYNVLLKDDKTYPSIAITKEYLPRVFSTRKIDRKGATYYGPYSHLPTMHALLELCQRLYHPRPCRQPMTEEGVKSGKYEVCLDYHIRKCAAPCCGKQSREDYLNNIEACREILKGNTREVARKLREEMELLSEEMRFEEAHVLKKKYELIENFRAKSEVVSNVNYDIDVFSMESDEKNAYINFLHVVNGAITQSFTFEFKKKLDETDDELLALGIVEMRKRFDSQSKELVLPFPVELPEEYARQTIPQMGGKKTLLDLSRQNVRQFKFDRLKQAEKLNPEQKQVRLMKEIQTQLALPSLPMHIELFDNSNISGEDAVAACVVFEKLKPAKKQYRKFNIKSVVGADDYASMREVVERRYSRLVAEEAPLPDLIIADGGKGQMEAIRSIVVEKLGLSIPIAGLVKDGKHRTREMLFGASYTSVAVRPDTLLFKLLTQMQDEVHRFAISFHRDKRSKRQLSSELDNISGIGEKSKASLLKEFGSVKRIKEATLEQIQKVLGKARGNHFFMQIHPDFKEKD